MSTCRWCTPGGSVTVDLLNKYAAGELHGTDLLGANDDLCYCMECVLEYHRARDGSPNLHKRLWNLETSRVIAQLEKSMHEEIDEDDELFFVDEDGEKPIFGYTGPNFESNVRVPLLESLKYPYLLLNQRVSELCVEALCKMEQVNNPFQVYEKLAGVYLLLVHPNENIRRWAILTARAQGKVERDDYYDLQEVFTCLFKVIELGLFENPDIYSTELEQGKLILLPPHLYDVNNYKNYWLGICMLLTVLEEQAMDSLLLGPDKQNFLQSILHVMEKYTEDEKLNPFWPALHCFMMILDRLGSKVWGQLIDPIQAFQTIISSPSYNNEIENVRASYNRPSKSEPDASDDEDLVTCSQMVYSFNTEKKKKDTGWKKAICPDYCPNMYEEMQCLANVLQSDIGQDMRIHDSTFLWFVPYVQSVMDLKDLGVAYIIEVIHHLYSEIKDVFNPRNPQSDKVTELFILVLVSIIELHRNKKCLHLLWVSSHKWVEALVKCAMLPTKDQQLRNNSRISSNSFLPLSPTSHSGSSVQYSCMLLIRSLLREGYQLGQQAACKPYLDKLNLLIRANVCRTLELSKPEAQGLQMCLTQIIKSVKDKVSSSPNSHLEQVLTNKTQSVPFIKIERMEEDDDIWYGSSCTSSLQPVVNSSLCVKNEHQESRTSEEKLDPSTPGCSSVTTINVKKEIPESIKYVSSAKNGCSSTVLPNIKSKKDLSGWQSKLSKVMEKTLLPKSKRVISADEQNTNGRTYKSQSKTLLPLKVQVKTEQCDQWLIKPKDVKSENFTPSNLKINLTEDDADGSTVARPLERLSLEPKSPEMMSVSVKEFTLDQENKSLASDKPQMNCRPSSTSTDDPGEAEDDDDIPLTEIKKKLLKSHTKTLKRTNSQVDRDLDDLSLAAHAKVLSFPGDSSQDTSSQEPSQIERRVKGAMRSSVIDDSSSDTDTSSNQVITISDNSSEDEIKPFIMSMKKEKNEDWSASSTPGVSKLGSEVQVKSEPSSSTCDEYNSQLFEFETQDDIFSVWGDSQVDQKSSSPEQAIKSSNQSPETNKPTNSNGFDLSGDFNQWGYDTDYICDEVIEKAVEDAEKQFKLSMTSTYQKEPEDEKCCEKNSSERFSSKQFYGKHSHKSNKWKSLAVPKKESLSPEASLSRKPETTISQKISKSKVHRNKSPVKARLESKKHSSPRKPTLAVVPPKKIRVCPEPASTAERLGLKKAPRKAFDLSQRSLDSLAELRDYGKSAGMFKSDKQKTKLISPKSLLVKGNKKLLACQDLQFYRQSRPKEIKTGSKETKKGKQASVSEKHNRKVNEAKQTMTRDNNETESFSVQSKYKHRNSTETNPSMPEKEEPKVGEFTSSKNSDSADLKQNVTDDTLTEIVKKASSPNDHAISSLSSTVNDFTNNKGEEEDDDGLQLTQADPVDMEVCSQEEYDIEIGIFEDNEKCNIVESSASVPETTEKQTCKHTDCSEALFSGDYCAKHTIPGKADDHVFAKPGLPPSFQKYSKPSTTKIFNANNTSRSAALSKDLENIPKIPCVSKSKAPSSKPPVPRPILPSNAQKRTSVTQNTNSVLQPLINQNNIYPQTSLAVTSETGKLPQYQTNYRPVQHVPAWLMKEVLRWKYEMFDNVSQFGPPKNLCPLPLLKVPLLFSGYEEYFNVFFPLMLLNTFESLAQDWVTKQRVINSHICKLQLQNFCLDSQVNRGDFQVWFRDADLNSQRHPKEDDLVFLITPDPSSSIAGDESSVSSTLVYHTGYVSRFTRSQRTQMLDKEHYTLCDLCIHTYGNLSGCRNEQVQCVVIGSLVTTQRQCKALVQLQRNPFFRPIIHPNPTDFMPRDKITSQVSMFPSLKEYNSDQRYAIERAYAMVKRHPRLPRICMIHGPPGTGKSKTIVGLLYRILTEKSNTNIPDQNLNAKNKRNRVLVCAPSNAAIDDLMKKIILEFKEKCQDKNNTLGNCGDINLVRLGSERVISSDVVKFSLDCQVNYRINRAQHDTGLHKQKEALDRQLDELCRQRAMERCNKNTCDQLDETISRLSKDRQLLANALRELRRRPQELQRNIILESHVICCTLSTSGGFLLESAFRQLGQEPFSCVIVDEAGQSCEVENLIPLLHRCSKLVLVGDPEQLPPTVISVRAEELGYGQSLMSRLCKHMQSLSTESPVLQLTVQYRMHPDICLFPSNYFYKRILKTDRAIEEVRCSIDWPFQPYMVFDVVDGFEKKERE
ncbi:Hypothetical predicted protein [Pelobates cultripes]|uniref:Senataxin n=2 Tax=Pelobates cultripes TaxID=61616 RepID=A0AAD1T3H2_PELCU|nr:Hypothetical predicted protein [Pelobates cultripes]